MQGCLKPQSIHYNITPKKLKFNIQFVDMENDIEYMNE
jgi:hypothetical protein